MSRSGLFFLQIIILMCPGIAAFNVFQDALNTPFQVSFFGGGPKKKPKSVDPDDAILEQAMAAVQLASIQVPDAVPETLMINRQEYVVRRVSGQDQNCFFHALAEAGVYMDRPAAIEILRQVQTFEERQWIYNEVWQLLQEGHFRPSGPDLEGDALIDDFLFNYLGAPEHENGFHMIGFRTDVPGIIDVLANAIGIRIRIVQQDRDGNAAVIRETIPNDARPTPRVVTLLHQGLHFDLLQTERDRDELQRFPPLYDGFSVMSPVESRRIDAVMSTIVSLLDAAREYVVVDELLEGNFSFLNMWFENQIRANQKFRNCNSRIMIPYVETIRLRHRISSRNLQDPEPFRLILEAMQGGFDIHPNFFKIMDFSEKGEVFFKRVDSINRAKKLVNNKLLQQELFVVELRNMLSLLQGNEKKIFEYQYLRDFSIALTHLGLLCDRAEKFVSVRQHEEKVRREETKNLKEQELARQKLKLEQERLARQQDEFDKSQAKAANERERAEQIQAQNLEREAKRVQREQELSERRFQKQQFESMIAWALVNRAAANKIRAPALPFPELPMFNRTLLVQAGVPDWGSIYREIERIGGRALLNVRGNNRHLLMWTGANGEMISYFFDAIHGAQESKGSSCGAIRGLIKRLSATGRLSV